LGSGSPCPH